MRTLTLPVILLLSACGQDTDKPDGGADSDDGPADTDTDTDSDADADADADSDADADADTDADADADTDADTDADADTDTDTIPVDDDGDGFLSDVDCDDADDTVFPGAPEVCGDGRVTDCDLATEDGLLVTNGVTSSDLQAALDAASPGDEIVVCGGTWTGPFTAPVAVRLVAFYGAATTVLDGAVLGPVLTAAPDTSVTGFTLTNGRSNLNGGGITLSAVGALTVDACVITDNEAALRGGGLAVPEGATATVTNSTIRRNHAVEGGGIHVPAGAIVDITSSAVRNNSADAGGGVLLNDGTLIGGVVDDNVANGVSGDLYGGGGIGALGDSFVVGTEVSNNEATYGCGFSSTLGTFTVTDGSIHDNGIPYGPCMYGGGGQVYLGDLVLEGSTVVRANHGNYGGGLMVQESTLIGGTVDGNTCGQEGGGIYILDGSSVTDAIVVNNTAPVGGGGVLLRFGGRFVGGVVSANSAPVGGGFSNTYDGLLEIEGTEITDNVATGDGGGIYQSSGTATLTNVVVLRNTANRGGGAFLDGGTLESLTSDWGAAADDNVPDDVRAGSSITGYEAGETFGCGLGCDPLP